MAESHSQYALRQYGRFKDSKLTEPQIRRFTRKLKKEAEKAKQLSDERNESLRLSRIIPSTVGRRLRVNKMHKHNLTKWREGEELNKILNDAILRHKHKTRKDNRSRGRSSNRGRSSSRGRSRK